MTPRSVFALATAIVLAGCNKPAPEPAAAAPDTGAVDTVAAAAPLADSAAAVTDSVATTTDTLLNVPGDSAADTTVGN